VHARCVVDAGKTDLDEGRAGLGEIARRALDRRFIRSLAKRCTDRHDRGRHAMDVGEHIERHRTERARVRILRIDDVGAALERGARFAVAGDADQESHESTT